VGHLGGENHVYWRLETSSTAGIGSGYSAKVILLRVDSILPARYPPRRTQLLRSHLGRFCRAAKVKSSAETDNMLPYVVEHLTSSGDMRIPYS
jgi:hypothetical protein